MIDQVEASGLSIKLYENRVIMGERAAALVIDKIACLLAEQDEVNIIFAAAPSQNEFLARLKQADLDWTRINAFHMDEYVGLPENAPQRFGNFLKQALFNHVPFKAVYYLNGSADDLTGECRRYAELLKHYPTDIVCMGIGENGHIAFNDPPVANFNDTELVKIVELDNACRQQQVNDGCFDRLNKVPTHALTLTVPALMAGRFVYCMVPGVRKAEAVYNTLNQEVIEQYPSTILRKHAHVVLFLDQDSSSLCG